jgi:hypothetical protein
MSQLAWYVHRWRAMGVAEMMAHSRKKWRQLRDNLLPLQWTVMPLDPRPAFPALPPASSAPAVLREALQSDGAGIQAGRWRIFGQSEVRLTDPPQWQRDYFQDRDLTATRSAFHLNHRALPGGADIRVVWELSRWHPLARLAQAAYVLGQQPAGETCLRWLADWTEKNPPYQGWNWTSALEAGLRLVQFCWIDALLTAAGQTVVGAIHLATLRQQLLPPHVYFVDRYRSFGSSANNHLLGELAGLIQALIRWPALNRWTTSLDTLQQQWQAQVLAQFAEDGGNLEQALNYHLLAWELCWQTRTALRSAGRVVAPEVEERLGRAAAFYGAFQSGQEPWDYGDSDSSLVTPLFADVARAVQEWHRWLSFYEPSSGRTALLRRPNIKAAPQHPPNTKAAQQRNQNTKAAQQRRPTGTEVHEQVQWEQEASRDQATAIHYWLGDPPTVVAQSSGIQTRAGWQIHVKSGQAVFRQADWLLRWDLSPLGYLGTAAHGHLDALHLSVWHGGRAWVIDPGTGAYYSNASLRTYLASWEAHNGPQWVGENVPPRQGPFLWVGQHSVPRWQEVDGAGLKAELSLPKGVFNRTITPVDPAVGWRIEDTCVPLMDQRDAQFKVCWQFAPACRIEQLTDRRWGLHRDAASLEVCLSDTWGRVELVEPKEARQDGDRPDWRGICSPRFRCLEAGPRLELTASAKKACVFCTTILVSARA